MHLATRIAAWALALCALGYGLLLFAAVTSSAARLSWLHLLFLPAIASWAALFRIPRVQRGAHRRLDLLIAAGLFGAVLFFGRASYNMLMWELFPPDWSLRGARGSLWGAITDSSLGYFAVPAALSAWVGWVFLRSGFRAVRAPRGPAR